MLNEFRDLNKKIKDLVKIKAGDILVLPKYPEYDCFSIVEAVENKNGKAYGYDKGPETLESSGFIHFVRVDEKFLRLFNYQAEKVPVNMSKMLKSIAYSAPINRVRKTEYIEAVKKCLYLEFKADLLESANIVKKEI